MENLTSKKDSLKFLSLNTRGLSNFKKRKTIFNWCRKNNADIIFLQETHSLHKFENSWTNEWGGKIVFSHGNSNARGVLILFRNNLDYKITSINSDIHGRYIILEIEVFDKIFVLINLYAPNNDKNIVEFFEHLKKHIKRQKYG